MRICYFFLWTKLFKNKTISSLELAREKLGNNNNSNNNNDKGEGRVMVMVIDTLLFYDRSVRLAQFP